MLELLADNRYVIGILCTAILFVMGVLIRQYIARTKEKEEELKTDINEKHEHNAQKLEAISTTVSAIYKSLADVSVLAHRVDVAERHIQDLRDFKHNLAEPAIRYLNFLQQEPPWKAEENHLARIEKKIDVYEERSATTRHDILDTVHALALKVAVIEKTTPPHDPR